MLGDNSPWSRDGRAWGTLDQIDPDLPGHGWDNSGRAELGGPGSSLDRQGVLRLLASPQAGLAPASDSVADIRLPILPYIERMRWIR